MTSQPETDSPRQSLRERAEAAWQARHRDRNAISHEDLAGVVHELEVHQIEHELQIEELRREQAELERVIDETPFMLTRCSRDLRYRFASAAYAESIGRHPRDLVGKPIVEIMGEEGFATIRPYVEAVLRGTRVEYEADVHFKGLGPRSLQVIYTPDVDADGVVQGWIASILDISARKNADVARASALEAERSARVEAERASAELQRQTALLDSAHDSIFVRDPEGHITYWNEGAADCYGWSKEEALGKVAQTLLQTQFPESLERILDMVKRTGHWEGELVQTCRDGRRVTMNSRWVIQRDAEGDGFRILAINNDITERKQLEHERDEEGRRKDEFLALLGHELRNPLAAIFTAAHVLRNATPAQRSKMEDIIGRQTAVMRRLVDDLLDLERITHGPHRTEAGARRSGRVSATGRCGGAIDDRESRSGVGAPAAARIVAIHGRCHETGSNPRERAPQRLEIH
jgi:PAS domain S-box-containing protein